MRIGNRTRHWLAALLLVLSPALAGQLAPLLHPCGAASVGAVATHDGQSGHASHTGHTTGGDSESADHDVCTCLGSCTSPAINTAAPTTTVVAQVAPGIDRSPVLLRTDADLVGDRPLDLLPPPTAPPHA